MTTIKVTLNDQDVTIVQKPPIASGDVETVILHADFSPEWDGYGKTGVFYQNEKNVFHALLDDNNECVIPWEALQAEGAMYFGIFGVKNGTRKTSEVVKYRVRKGAWSKETAASDPTPDIYTQILSSVTAHDTVVKNAVYRNLLDNSDFRNPVNQRGKKSYTGGYTVDRWKLTNSAWTVTVDDGYLTVADNTSSSSTATVMLQQSIPIDASIRGKTVTLAAKLKGNDVRININNGEVSGYYGTDDWRIKTITAVVPEDADTFFVALQSRNAVTWHCEWVALYEGEYTAENLPEYQPKGYGAELLECQRYYQIRSTNNIAAVDMRPVMRIESPTISSVTGGYSYSADL